MKTRFVLAFAVAACSLGGCDRPFVDVRPPDIEVLAPDPGTVVAVDSVRLRIRATSFRAVSGVDVDGVPADPAGTDMWSTSIRLSPGLNAFVITAWDEDDIPGVDTLHLLRVKAEYTEGPASIEATGGHTATLLPDGRVFLAGGASEPGTEATRHTWFVDPGSDAVAPGPDLLRARTGHTTTLLPDGRLVVLGGSRIDPPGSVADLVETVEVLDPGSDAFRELPVTGDPVRRAFHTAEFRASGTRAIVDLLGGTGDVRYGDAPRLAIRDDLRSFRIGPDAVEALIGWFGLYIDPFTGHTQTALDPAEPGSDNRFLLVGTIFDDSRDVPFTYVMDTRDPRGILLFDIRAPAPLRNEHAAVRMPDGLVLLLGGRTPTESSTASASVYVDLLESFIRVPPHALGEPLPRRRHTATLLPDGRILLWGGYGLSDRARATSGYLYID